LDINSLCHNITWDTSFLVSQVDSREATLRFSPVFTVSAPKNRLNQVWSDVQKYATFQAHQHLPGATKIVQHSLCRLQNFYISGAALMTPAMDLPYAPFDTAQKYR
jgi:hypothetical protein